MQLFVVVIADIPLYFTMLLSRGVQTLFTGNSPLYPLTQLNEEKTFLVWNRTEVPKLFEKMFLSDKLQKQKLIPSSTGLISKKYRFKGSNRVKFDIFDELLRFADEHLEKFQDASRYASLRNNVGRSELGMEPEPLLFKMRQVCPLVG